MLELSPSVWRLGWVSLATDAATEAIYPLLPFFLTRVVGAGVVSLGVIEGVAEAAASVLKLASGRLADRWRVRKPLVVAGYSISSLVRPFIALAASWPQVLAIRFCDRVGKGIRGAPRDAMLAAWATPDTRGLVYGVHRAMDNAGAIVGPLAASLVLLIFPDRYRLLFALTIIPGAIAIWLVIGLPEVDDRPHAVNAPPGGGKTGRVAAEDVASAVSLDWRRLPRDLHVFMAILTLFTLGNSTDAFLLLRLTDQAGGVTFVPLFWAALNAVKVVASIAGGAWSDRLGRRTVIAAGWLVYAAVYAGFAASQTLPPLLAWFFLYGLYFGFTEGVEKALIADLSPAELRGTAFGIYTAVQGFGSLLASVVFGLIWKTFGAPVAFATGATLALAATLMLPLVRTSRGSADKRGAPPPLL